MTDGSRILFGLLLSVHVVCGTVISCSITDTRTGKVVVTQAKDPVCFTGVPHSGLTELGFSMLEASPPPSFPAFFTINGLLDTSFANAVYGTPDDYCDGELCGAFIFKWSARRTAMRRLRTEIRNDSGLGSLEAFIDTDTFETTETPACRYGPLATISIKQGNGPFQPVGPGRPVPLKYNRPFDILMDLNLSLECEMSFTTANAVAGSITRSLSVEIFPEDISARTLYVVDVEIPEPATANLILAAVAGFVAVRFVRSANSMIRHCACCQKFSMFSYIR